MLIKILNSIPVGTPGVLDEKRSSVSPTCCKRRLKWAVSRNNHKKGGPMSVLGRAR